MLILFLVVCNFEIWKKLTKYDFVRKLEEKQTKNSQSATKYAFRKQLRLKAYCNVTFQIRTKLKKKKKIGQRKSDRKKQEFRVKHSYDGNYDHEYTVCHIHTYYRVNTDSPAYTIKLHQNILYIEIIHTVKANLENIICFYTPFVI